MTRHVFDNYQTAHVWASQTQDSGRSHNSNLWFEGRVIYSYGRHFPLAYAGEIDGGRVFLLNADSYSVSTARHQSIVCNAVFGQIHHVPDLGKIIDYQGELRDVAELTRVLDNLPGTDESATVAEYSVLIRKGTK